MFKPTIISVLDKTGRRLASAKLAFAGMSALVLAVLYSYFNQSASLYIIALPLMLLALNLLAAIVFNTRIRGNAGLLLFHIALLAIAVLSALTQLTHMQGRIEIASGQFFEANNMVITRQGPLHSTDSMESIIFRQGGFEIDYAAGLRRGETRSSVITDDSHKTVGDNVPLVVDGYRFYTTSNKGYAAVIAWQDRDSLQYGVINFPSFPLYSWKQENSWLAPDGSQLHFKFMPATQVDEGGNWRFSSEQLTGELMIRLEDGTETVLLQGESIRIGKHRLTFETMTTWMGYSIFYNPWLNAFLVFAMLGVVGLGLHYYQRFSPEVSQQPTTDNTALLNNKVSV